MEAWLARKKSPGLTDAELKLMEVVWGRGRATVSDVVDSLPKGDPLAYSTVLTTMRILEKKGYLRSTERRNGKSLRRMYQIH